VIPVPDSEEQEADQYTFSLQSPQDNSLLKDTAVPDKKAAKNPVAGTKVAASTTAIRQPQKRSLATTNNKKTPNRRLPTAV